jgi:DNA-binding IclR family transcriptional regulator
MLASCRAGCTFSQLRTVEARLTAASLSRLLKVMREEEVIRKDENSGRYYLGEAMVRLAREITCAMPVDELLQPVVHALATETQESAAWFEADGEGAVLMAKDEVPESFHYIAVHQRIGTVLSHAIGQVLLAWSTPTRRAELLQANGPLPEALTAYERRLEAIRHGQLLVHDLPEGGTVRFAAPVFWGADGDLAGVLAITCWPREFAPHERENFAAAVSAAARRATALLGGR